MAIEGLNPTQNQNQNTTTLGDAFAAGGQNAGFQQQTSESGISFNNLASLIGIPVSRTSANEVLENLNSVAQKLIEHTSAGITVTLLPIDKNTVANLGFSVLVVALQENTDKSRVAYHTLILEASADAPPPIVEVWNNNKYEIVRHACEAYDQDMLNVVGEQLKRVFPKANFINADACVVPRDFDVRNELQVKQLLGNAIYADATELGKSRPNFRDLTLTEMGRDSTLAIRTAFGNPPVLDVVNHPLRSDVSVELVSMRQNRGQPAMESLNRQGDSGKVVSQVNGFIDLVWDPVMPVGNMMYYAPQQPLATQKYAARLVITNLESKELLTIPAQLLALAGGTFLQEDNGWVGAFRPRAFGNKETTFHDIGGVGIEMNLEGNPTGYGVRVDTKKDSFTPDQLARLISMAIRPGLIISVDVPECDPQTWYNGFLGAGGRGVPDAIEAILYSANLLTNGHFGRRFPQNEQIFVNDNNRIHMGYYFDKNGEKRDIRDVDMLAVMNVLGEKDPLIIRRWSDTFLRHDVPMSVRMADRMRIIEGIAGTVTFTGYARRVTFTQKFIEALLLAVKDTGMTIRNVSSSADMGMVDRATGSFLNNALMSGNVTGLFTRDFGGFNGQGRPMANYGGRW